MNSEAECFFFLFRTSYLLLIHVYKMLIILVLMLFKYIIENFSIQCFAYN